VVAFSFFRGQRLMSSPFFHLDPTSQSLYSSLVRKSFLSSPFSFSLQRTPPPLRKGSPFYSRCVRHSFLSFPFFCRNIATCPLNRRPPPPFQKLSFFLFFFPLGCAQFSPSPAFSAGGRQNPLPMKVFFSFPGASDPLLSNKCFLSSFLVLLMSLLYRS